MVWIRDAGTLRAIDDGRRWELPNDPVVCAGWRGLIRAEGDGLSIRMLGGIIEFTAKGTGWVHLRGRGDYIVNGEAGHWTLEGVRLALTLRSGEQ